MYLLKFLSHQVVFIEEQYDNMNNDGALIKYSGTYDYEQIKILIEHGLSIADGNPIRVTIPVEDEVFNLIEEMGLYLNKKGYLSSLPIKLSKNEMTAIKLLRDGYTIEMQNGELIIC